VSGLIKLRQGERWLITGASGFIGRAALPWLVNIGAEIHAVSRHLRTVGSRSQDALNPRSGITWHACNLLNPTESSALVRWLKPSVLIHAAWYVEHGEFWDSAQNDLWLDASIALGRSFVEAGGKRLIGIGTCAEYAEAATDDDLPWPETRPVRPATRYGQAKAELHHQWQELSTSSGGTGLAWARLFHVFGPGEHSARLVPSLVSALLAGQPALCSSGRAIRDYASANYVAHAIAAIAASSVNGAINVGSGRGCRIADLALLLAQKIGRPDLLRLGALPDRLPEVPVMVADTSRLCREVGVAECPPLDVELNDLLVGSEQLVFSVRGELLEDTVGSGAPQRPQPAR